MAVILVKITTSETVTQANRHVRDSSNAHEGLQALENFISRINSGSQSAQVDVFVSDVDQTIVASGGGKSSSHNKK